MIWEIIEKAIDLTYPFTGTVLYLGGWLCFKYLEEEKK